MAGGHNPGYAWRIARDLVQVQHRLQWENGARVAGKGQRWTIYIIIKNLDFIQKTRPSKPGCTSKPLEVFVFCFKKTTHSKPTKPEYLQGRLAYIS